MLPVTETVVPVCVVALTFATPTTLPAVILPVTLALPLVVMLPPITLPVAETFPPVVKLAPNKSPVPTLTELALALIVCSPRLIELPDRYKSFQR